jgi:thiol:disulfide interchange protein DsbD
VLLLAGIVAGGLHLEVSGMGVRRKLRKGAASLVTGVGVFGLVLAFSPGETPSPAWTTEYRPALKAAAEASRPVILDFYADWCTACKELDRKTWSDKKVIAESARFTMIRVNATSQNDTVDELEDEYGVLGLPAVLFLGPDGREVSRLRITGFIKPDEMLRHMMQVK